MEERIDTGPQRWKEYAIALLLFNIAIFIVGFAVLALQPLNPSFLNPDGKGMLSPTTTSRRLPFLTNTNLQHYSGEVQLSYGSQIFFICWKQFHTPAIGLRGPRGNYARDGAVTHTWGNFYVDLWRSAGVLVLADGVRPGRAADR